jgi:hypothetical protein
VFRNLRRAVNGQVQSRFEAVRSWALALFLCSYERAGAGSCQVQVDQQRERAVTTYCTVLYCTTFLQLLHIDFLQLNSKTFNLEIARRIYYIRNYSLDIVTHAAFNYWRDPPSKGHQQSPLSCRLTRQGTLRTRS